MISIVSNFIDYNEINYILSHWVKNPKLFCNNAIRFHFVDFLENKIDLTPINSGSFAKVRFDKIWLQKQDENVDQIDIFHGHKNIHNYILYLNDNFDGGKLIFDNGVEFSPKAGTLVYFNNNEKHKVTKCVGDRYTLSLWGNTEVDLHFKKHSIKRTTI